MFRARCHDSAAHGSETGDEWSAHRCKPIKIQLEANYGAARAVTSLTPQLKLTQKNSYLIFVVSDTRLKQRNFTRH